MIEISKNNYHSLLGSDELIIGDGNSVNFKPQIKFSKWNGENTLTIRYNKIYNSLPIQSLDEDYNKEKLSISDDGDEFYICPFDSKTLKFGLVFKKKPATNTFTFELEGWEDFDFFYQPPLTNVNSDGSTWDGSNKEKPDAFRPANVNGSYAIYHKTKKNYIIDKINYMVGKFGHIFRPKFIAANGDWVWGDLNIENRSYNVTIPQEFLDKAQYPIKANDTFGNENSGASYTVNDNTPHVCKATSNPASNGSLVSVSLYCGKSWWGGEQFCPAIYSDSTGTPNALLAGVEVGTAISTTEQWETTNLSYSGIQSGTQYWLGHKDPVPISDYNYWFDSGDAGEEQYGSSGAWQNPFSVTGTNARRVSIYATYTPGGVTFDALLIAGD